MIGQGGFFESDVCRASARIDRFMCDFEAVRTEVALSRLCPRAFSGEHWIRQHSYAGLCQLHVSPMQDGGRPAAGFYTVTELVGAQHLL